MKSKEKGFILITALVLLAILTLLGLTSAYKTTTQIKVSRTVAHMEAAKSAANSGLTQMYWEWTVDPYGQADFQQLSAYTEGSGTAPGIYQGDFTPDSVADITDLMITTRSGIKVYTFQSGAAAPVTNVAWGASAESEPQVAVWMTTFDDTYAAPNYPYTAAIDLTGLTASAAQAACSSGCRFVTYALGRSGVARSLVREGQSFVSQQLEGVSALTNAPPGKDFADICNPPTGTPSSTANGSAWATSATGNNSTVVEATQAPYLLGSIPSGTALASNTTLGSGGKGFRSGTSSQTGATFESVPYLLYSGHGTESAYKVDWAALARDTTGVNLPVGKLPQQLVNAPLLGGNDEVEYFKSANAQLFDMDTYRWAAEQFTCQDPSKPDGKFGNGIYCSKAEKLRVAVDTIFNAASGGAVRAFAPVTGRLTIAQIEYNVANAIPMFGVIRLMFPAVPDSGVTATCGGTATQLHVIESAGDQGSGSYDFNKLKACDGDCAYTGSIPDPSIDPYGRYAFTITEGAIPDNDGDLGSNARLIVYGTLLIDYFADYNIVANPTGGSVGGATTDTVFNPADGERLLLPLESPDVYLAIELNMMINPVMPRFNGATPLPFPTAASDSAPRSTAGSPSRLGYPAPALNEAAATSLTTTKRINMLNIPTALSLKVNLASPYDGEFPWSEGMLPPSISESNAGTMRLMSRASPADNSGGTGLMSMVKISAGSKITAPNADMTTLLALSNPSGVGKAADILHYYYDLMVTSLDQSRPNDWPVAPWPGNTLAADFCIGKQDCGASFVNNMGDKAHLMFPTGYMHAWKVALAALDITADEWNHILSGGNAPRVSIGHSAGLYKQLFKDCNEAGASALGSGCRMGKPFNFGVDSGGLNQAAVQGFAATEGKFFYVTPDLQTGYGLLDSDWKDIPSTLYSGGLLDMHAHSNMNGIIYTPGPLEWEPGNSNYDTGVHMSYVNGSIITGYGAYIKNQTADDRYVLVFDMQAVDNINTNNATIVLRRFDWQMLN